MNNKYFILPLALSRRRASKDEVISSICLKNLQSTVGTFTQNHLERGGMCP